MSWKRHHGDNVVRLELLGDENALSLDIGSRSID